MVERSGFVGEHVPISHHHGIAEIAGVTPFIVAGDGIGCLSAHFLDMPRALG